MKGLIKLAIFVLLVALLIALLAHAASFLVVDDPKQADVLLVLAGYEGDARFWHAVQLMHDGYANRIIVDADASRTRYGQSDAQLATQFVRQSTPGRAIVCPTQADSTYDEAADAAICLAPLSAKSVLIVTSDYHTRRALSIFQKRLPQYQWSVASAAAPYHFANQWWKHRRWAKGTLDEWEKLLWWELVDRWKANTVLQ